MPVSHLQKYHKSKFLNTNYYYYEYELYVMKPEYKTHQCSSESDHLLYVCSGLEGGKVEGTASSLSLSTLPADQIENPMMRSGELS